MDWREFVQPDLKKTILFVVLLLILPNIAYWECRIFPPYHTEYRVHVGIVALLIQTGLLMTNCINLTYFYFWPLAVVIAYLVSCGISGFVFKKE